MLTIQNAIVNYGESTVLNDVTLSVPAGQVICLMGRNGMGKTTLMKTVMGILKPRSGSIHFGDEEMTRWPSSRRARAGIGYVPQGRGIFPYLSVYENLLMGFESTPTRKPDEAALDRTYRLFPVLQQMGKRVAGTLSGGQQQQLAIGRVLLRDPKLLMLDEPTEGIQPSIMREIEEIILMLRQEATMSILLVEQFLDFALKVGSYFYIMETGAIVMEGPISQFNEEKAKEYLAV